MTLVPHFLILLFKCEIGANYSFSPAKVRASNRKEIARELRDEIVSAGREAAAPSIKILLCDGHFAADAEGAAGDF